MEWKWPHPIPGFDPNHYFYDRQGNPIDLLTWGQLMEDLDYRFVGSDETNGAILNTVYLGHVDPRLSDARLFGTALIVGIQAQQIQVYDSEAEALAGHQAHLEARSKAFHCHLCQIGEAHDD